jgi:hypothetical protein
MKSKHKFVPSQVVPMFAGDPMNTNDLNARSSLTKRQRRSQAPRVECLESRELLTYPAPLVQGLINQAVFAHRNTAVQTIALVDNALKIDLGATGLLGAPLTVLNATPLPLISADIDAFQFSVVGVVNQYVAGATAPAGTLGSLARFPFVERQVVAHAQNLFNAITLQNVFWATGSETDATYLASVNSVIVNS